MSTAFVFVIGSYVLPFNGTPIRFRKASTQKEQKQKMWPCNHTGPQTAMRCAWLRECLWGGLARGESPALVWSQTFTAFATRLSINRIKMRPSHTKGACLQRSAAERRNCSRRGEGGRMGVPLTRNAPPQNIRQIHICLSDLHSIAWANPGSPTRHNRKVKKKTTLNAEF